MTKFGVYFSKQAHLVFDEKCVLFDVVGGPAVKYKLCPNLLL